MSAQLGLYYPFIHFRDESWLKLTSLYWDRMGRIVPAQYGLRDSPTVRDFAAGGYVLDHAPGGNTRAQAAQVLQGMVTDFGERLAERYGIRSASNWPDEPSTVQSKSGHFGNAKLAYIYDQKMSVELIEDLVSFGLAEEGGRRAPFWIGMHPRIAAVYMTSLADAMAASRGAVPVSDDVLSYLAIGDATMTGLADALLEDGGSVPASNRTASVLMANLAIRAVAPTNLEHVPVRDLIAFRDRYAQERTAFQDQVNLMVQSLTAVDVTEPEAFEDLLRVQYEKLLRPHIDDIEQRLRRAKIDTTAAIFNIKTNMTGFGGAAALEYFDAPKLVVGSSAVALSLWGLGREHERTRRSILTENRAASYLYQIHTNVDPTGFAKKLAAIGHRFWG